MLANIDIQKLYVEDSLPQHRNFKPASLVAAKDYDEFQRIRMVTLIAMFLTTMLVVRLVYLNTVSTKFLANQMNSRIMRTQVIPAMRGDIVDRDGNPLAISTPVSSIWVDPSDLDDLSNEQIKTLAKILMMPVAELNKKLNEKNKHFVYLKRAVSPETAALVMKVGVEGISTIQEYKRYYPNGEITAHLVGFNNIDDKGSEGIEYAKNKELIGENGSRQVLKDRDGSVVENVGVTNPANNGATIQLAINNKIQYIAYNALKNQVEKYHAKAGSAIVMDAKTGEVLSMVNMPTYNPNNRHGTDLNMLRNRAVTNVYDPGSIMKPIVIAKALDDKKVTTNTVFDTHPYRVGIKLIKDDEPEPSLSVEEIMIKSSDIGTSKIALKYQPETLWSYYKSVGFGDKIGSGFPGETTGILPNWKRWHPMDQALMSFGYGISVSLFQMAHAYTEFTNNGCVLPVSFYKLPADEKVACTQVIKPSTARTMRDLLQKVTEDGTGKNAQVDDYTTAGKTGTAQKNIGGHYSNHDHMASFVGFAPAKNPKVIIAVTVDSPKGSYYAAAVAAPVFAQIAEPTLHELGVTPDKSTVDKAQKIATK